MKTRAILDDVDIWGQIYSIATACNCAAGYLHLRAWRRRRLTRSWLAQLEVTRRDLVSLKRMVMTIRTDDPQNDSGKE